MGNCAIDLDVIEMLRIDLKQKSCFWVIKLYPPREIAELFISRGEPSGMFSILKLPSKAVGFLWQVPFAMKQMNNKVKMVCL